MSKGKVTKCNQCSHESIVMEQSFGGHSLIDWITVSRNSSSLGMLIGAGSYHFCSDKCLAAFVNKQTEAVFDADKFKAGMLRAAEILEESYAVISPDRYRNAMVIRIRKEAKAIGG